VPHCSIVHCSIVRCDAALAWGYPPPSAFKAPIRVYELDFEIGSEKIFSHPIRVYEPEGVSAFKAPIRVYGIRFGNQTDRIISREICCELFHVCRVGFTGQPSTPIAGLYRSRESCNAVAESSINSAVWILRSNQRRSNSGLIELWCQLHAACQLFLFQNSDLSPLWGMMWSMTSVRVTIPIRAQPTQCGCCRRKLAVSASQLWV